MTRSRTRISTNSVVGIGLTVVTAALLVWALAGKPDPFSSHYVVWAQFRGVSSLIRFDRDVRVGGVDVGTVGTIKSKGDIALVPLELDTSLRGMVRADATAELRPHTLFDGNSFIQLDPGSASAPPLDGHVISLAHTTNYVTIDQALRVLNAPTRRALQQAVGAMADTLQPDEVSALRRTFVSAPALTQHLAIAARALQGPTGGELATSIDGLAKTVSGIAHGARDIGPMLDGLSATATAINAQTPALQATLNTLPRTLTASLSGSDALRQTVADLQPVAAALVPSMRQLAPTLTDLRPILETAAPILAAAPPFLTSLAGTLHWASTVAPPTGSLLDRVTPIVDQVGSQLIPFLNAKTQDGSTNIQAMAALTSAAAGAISAVAPLTPGSAEGSHDFYGLLTLTPSCTSLPAVLAPVLKDLNLCSL